MKFSLSDIKGNRGQTPQVYVRTNKVSDRYNLFLTNQPNERPSYGVVEYAVEDQEWRMALGAFHGIPMDQQKEPTKVKLYEVGKESEGEEVGIKKVFPFYCLLDKSPIRRKIEGRLPTYRAELPGLNLAPLQVFVPAGTADEKTTKLLLKAKLEQSAAAMINLVESEPDADIVLRLVGGEFSLTKPGEADIPLVKRIGYLGGDNQLKPIKLDDLYAQLQQISRWQTLRDLEREGIPVPDSLRGKTSMYPVEFRLYRWDEKTETESRILPKDGRFLLDLEEDEKAAWIRFELVNYAPQILHAAMGLLGEDFGFLASNGSNPMSGAVIQLRAADDPQGEHIAKSRGAAKAVGGGREEKFIDLGLNQYHYDFNRFGETTFLKILASATPIDAIKTFHMKGLGFPQKTRGGTRGFGDSRSLTPPTPPEVEWDMRTIELFLTNPRYTPAPAPVA
jgi:hypothetical protein